MIKSFGRLFAEKLRERGIKVERRFTINWEFNYKNWNRKEKGQFRDALRSYEPPYAGYFIAERSLPVGHPARREGYNSHDVTAALVDLIYEMDMAAKKSKLTVARLKYELA